MHLSPKKQKIRNLSEVDDPCKMIHSNTYSTDPLHKSGLERPHKSSPPFNSQDSIHPSLQNLPLAPRIAGMDSSKILTLLELLDDEIDELEEAISPLLKTTISDSASKLPLLDKAKLFILVTYAIETMLFCKSMQFWSLLVLFLHRSQLIFASMESKPAGILSLQNLAGLSIISKRSKPQKIPSMKKPGIERNSA